MDTDLIPSVSIDNLVQRRDAAAERVHAVYATIAELSDLGCDLHVACCRHAHRDAAETIRRAIDTPAWADLLDRSGLKSFLDAAARKKWGDAIDKHDVPSFTHENIQATFSALYEARGTMFERGVCELFRKLSWEYATNNPVKFGKRLVLRYVVEAWGTGGNRYLSGISHNGANKLDDLLRVMYVLDGKPEPDHRNGAWHTCNGAQWMRDGSDVSVADFGYFSIRGFKNGNAHLTFHAPALVDRMNQIVARHYPNALPAAA